MIITSSYVFWHQSAIYRDSLKMALLYWNM